jgi:hypothetical protein
MGKWKYTGWLFCDVRSIFIHCVWKVIVQLLLSWQVCSKEHTASTVNVGAQHYSWKFWQRTDREQNTTCTLCEIVTSYAYSNDNSVITRRMWGLNRCFVKGRSPQKWRLFSQKSSWIMKYLRWNTVDLLMHKFCRIYGRCTMREELNILALQGIKAWFLAGSEHILVRIQTMLL